MADFVVRQVLIDTKRIKAIKVFAAEKDMALQDFYAAAAEALLLKREKGGRLHYMASPRNGKLLNTKIRPALFEQIVKASNDDSISLRCFLYTALVNFVDEII